MIDIHSYSNDSGIYGVYIDEALVYVGKTKNFHQRFNGLAYNIYHKENQWYPLAREFDKRGHSIEAKIIEKIPIQALSGAELEYVNELKPIFNVGGRAKGKTLPKDYDSAVALLGLEVKCLDVDRGARPQDGWFGEKLDLGE